MSSSSSILSLSREHPKQGKFDDTLWMDGFYFPYHHDEGHNPQASWIGIFVYQDFIWWGNNAAQELDKGVNDGKYFNPMHNGGKHEH